MLITDNVSKNLSPGSSVQCTIKIVILKKKPFREDSTVEDGQEVQQQRARALGRQQASGYGNLTRCWGAEQSKQKKVPKVRKWLQFAPHSSIFIAMILSNYE